MDDRLLKSAKKGAMEMDRTLAAAAEDAADQSPAKKTTVELPAFGSGGLLPKVYLDSASALQDNMEGRL